MQQRILLLWRRSPVLGNERPLPEEPVELVLGSRSAAELVADYAFIALRAPVVAPNGAMAVVAGASEAGTWAVCVHSFDFVKLLLVPLEEWTSRAS